MFFLLGCIVLTSYLILSFKVVERMGLNNLQVIVFNYWTCVITGSIVNGHFPVNHATIQQDWFPWAIAMGLVFIFLFNIIAFSAQRIGIAVTSVANKLSLVIPFLFSIYLYNEQASVIKIAGIVLALVAVAMTCYTKQDTGPASVKRSIWLYVLPIILFIGSGLLDTMIKYVEVSFLDGTNNDDYITTAFLSAAVIGLPGLFVQWVVRKKPVRWKAVAAGIAIGIPNYFSIWCLVQVLKQYQGNSSAILPINNMGIVVFSSLAAWLLFKEKLSILNWSGVILAVIAIALIAYG
jgi:drug/metabolite transporter (DMT)-like permease